eukprot:CAMPEP_0170579124 /NCGR_PEP_ID=MMETSP0224-20130122/5821_1 /TAXON_ID=285029 /ORGANISM="Togula jolla, Strain CCCM 725" /LENGTH=385 /DNA_ID=CAMNT_0010902137 /DNA_START=92 /DNA_END=1249 /DNA_ORIENTATION=+
MGLTQHGADGCQFGVIDMEIGDVEDFMALQDLLAEEHLAFTSRVYSKVTLRDWQLSLLCPDRILSEEGGRRRHAESMVRRQEAAFKDLIILKASAPSKGGEKPTMVGFVMFQVHQAEKRKPPKRGRPTYWDRVGCFGPWAQVKQIYVLPAFRRRGVGCALLTAMFQALPREARDDVRLSVLDLNPSATRWYRSFGFVVVSISRECLGDREDANVIVYQEMRCAAGEARLAAALTVPLIFRAEVLNQVVTVSYPDKSGVFDVRIVEYLEAEHWHKVDSAGLSVWDGESFTDTIDLNAFFRDGHVEFKRDLSLVYRDVELVKREARRVKQLLKRDEKHKRLLMAASSQPETSSRSVRQRVTSELTESGRGHSRYVTQTDLLSDSDGD